MLAFPSIRGRRTTRLSPSRLSLPKAYTCQSQQFCCLNQTHQRIIHVGSKPQTSYSSRLLMESCTLFHQPVDMDALGRPLKVLQTSVESKRMEKNPRRDTTRFKHIKSREWRHIKNLQLTQCFNFEGLGLFGGHSQRTDSYHPNPTPLPCLQPRLWQILPVERFGNGWLWEDLTSWMLHAKIHPQDLIWKQKLPQLQGNSTIFMLDAKVPGKCDFQAFVSMSQHWCWVVVLTIWALHLQESFKQSVVVLINFTGLVSIQNLPELFSFHIVDVDSQLSKPHPWSNASNHLQPTVFFFQFSHFKQFLIAGPEHGKTSPKKRCGFRETKFDKQELLCGLPFEPRCNVCTLMLDTCTLKSSNLTILKSTQLKSTPKNPTLHF